jgi:hypothetical protein
LKFAEAPVVILLNNDTLVPTGWAGRLVRKFDDQTIGLLGPMTNRTGNEAMIGTKYRTFGEMVRFAKWRAATQRGKSFDIEMLAMYCVAMRREVAQQIGSLDEAFGLGLFEDDDYAHRVRAAGFRVVCAADVFVHHFGEGSFGSLGAGRKQAALFQRNRLYFEKKWRRKWTPHERRVEPEYRKTIDAIAKAVEHLPKNADIAVVNRGDEMLLEAIAMTGRGGRHFPADADGGYTGFHPADSTQAMRFAQQARMAGAQFLLFPQTEFWWLKYYSKFAQALVSTCPTAVRKHRSCQIFDLRALEKEK